ncbi:ROK family transcriptional regulator [Spongiactinospora sp. TRM90649]|uniref:ROK family transcriptional regulator n=1 Tax=Spongiactinospora sp. TRM90649 TaxID=3031114 RepID=UPI0023F625D7|nr:ROK family transcriptional regulator [Spongiactinospora sp. TRM90649]MDF5756731.1 ROK family transcriptional regulator [Spongiactinospora sp. TRM90649]
MSPSVPGTPRLLRAINDRAALRALLERGPLTRPEIGAITGLSKPTASQLLSRLRAAGLVVLDGVREGMPGRTAELYRLNAAAAYVGALDVTPGRIDTAITDITGAVAAEHRMATPRARGDVVARVREALAGARAAAPGLPEPRRIVIGIQGALDPASGRLGYAAHIPGWHVPDLLATLREGLGVPVDVENDVNLVALAERRHGVARGHQDFVLLWGDSGLGSALVLGGRLHRGATGGAGEVGYMPAIGAPTMRDSGRYATHGFQALGGGRAVRAVLRAHGVRGATPAGAVGNAVRAAARGEERPARGLGEVAARLATGLASVVAVVDPEIVVLTGAMLLAGGETLRGLIERELHALTLPRPPLRLSTVQGNPVLAGAVELGLAAVREEVFGSAAENSPS